MRPSRDVVDLDGLRMMAIAITGLVIAAAGLVAAFVVPGAIEALKRPRLDLEHVSPGERPQERPQRGRRPAPCS